MNDGHGNAKDKEKENESKKSTESAATIEEEHIEKTLVEIKLECLTWSPKMGDHPLEAFLREHSHLPPGWLRRSEARHLGETLKMKHLLPREKMEMAALALTLSGVNRNRKRMKGISPIRDLAHAFGRCEKMIHHDIKRTIMRGMSGERKVKDDKGGSVFDCNFKRSTEYTPKNYFIRWCNHQNRAQQLPVSRRPSGQELDAKWQNLTQEERQQFEDGARRQRERSVHLKDELIQILKRAKRKLPWREVAEQINGNDVPIVSPETIRKYVKSQKNFPPKACEKQPDSIANQRV